jgi:outer membrane immunogenic protein
MKKFLSILLASSVFAVPAVAADLVVDVDIEDPVIAAYDWNGGYVGGFVGYGSGLADWNNGFGDVPLAGLIAGLDAGYNHRVGAFVLGVEGDIAWSGIAGSVPCTNPAFTCTTNIGWLSTLRGRAGVAADSALFYLTGGLAAGQVTSDSAPFTPGQTFSNLHLGWTAGAGIEFGVSEDVSLKVEYLYVDLGSRTETAAILGGGLTTVGVTTHVVKAGLNWQF